MGAAVVLNHGTEEMHQKHLKKIFTGEDIWCQLFSEPTHGSDVAGIPSKAIRDGDEWISQWPEGLDNSCASFKFRHVTHKNQSGCSKTQRFVLFYS